MDMINEAGKGEKTKYRLARSMKECMKTMSVDNITVKQITENCGVTRQTFYRNFMDKFDLINWYFDKLLATLYSGNVLPEFYLYDCKMGTGRVGMCTGGTGENFS